MREGQEYNPYCKFVGCMVPNVLTRTRILTFTAQICFGRLAQFAGENGDCFPSQKRLAKEMGLSVSGLNRALKELEDEGFIKRVPPSFQGRGDHRTTRYKFIWHPILEEGLLGAEGKQASATRECNSLLHESGEPTARKCSNLLHESGDKENHLRDSSKGNHLKEPTIPPTPQRGAVSRVPYQELLKIWNESIPPGIPFAKGLNDKRKKLLAKAWKDSPDFDLWRQVIRNLANNPFRMGHNDRGWKANIDYVAREIIKLVEELSVKEEQPVREPLYNPNKNCPQCKGLGYVRSVDADGIEAYRPCKCLHEAKDAA
jgi:DNA-binding transcriptional MocR family regulator